MDGTGRVVLLNRSPGCAGCRYQAVGMVERYHWIILGVNQQNRWRHEASRTQRLLDAMVTDRLVRARHQWMAIARVKQELSPQERQARQPGNQGAGSPRWAVPAGCLLIEDPGDDQADHLVQTGIGAIGDDARDGRVRRQQ